MTERRGETSSVDRPMPLAEVLRLPDGDPRKRQVLAMFARAKKKGKIERTLYVQTFEDCAVFDDDRGLRWRATDAQREGDGLIACSFGDPSATHRVFEPFAAYHAEALANSDLDLGLLGRVDLSLIPMAQPLDRHRGHRLPKRRVLALVSENDHRTKLRGVMLSQLEKATVVGS